MTFRDSFLFLFTISCLIISSAADDEQFKIVEISQGPVKGYINSGVYAFYGIPYATAPTGSSKFMGPLPGPIWSNTFEAVEKTVACPQVIGFHNVTEDCLVANVFLPDTRETGLPVVVTVYGGAYISEHSNQLTPLALVKEGNFIHVTGNYRLSAYGFLCLGTDAVPGNAALKDVLALLEWVKSNIADFGGNPEDVTLTGYSAGSAIASLIMMTDAADGLFNKVILESGSGYGSWGVAVDPIESAAAFARLEGLDTRDVSVLEEFYLNLPAEKLHFENAGPVDGSFYFAPCVEQQSRPGAILTDAPHNLLRKGSFNKVPVLISIADMEGRFRMDLLESMSQGMNENFSDFLPADLQFEGQEDKEKVAETVKEFYFGTEPVGSHSLIDFIDFQSDALFSHAAHRTVRELVEAGNEDVFFYLYSHREPDEIGADHCAQTLAIFDDVKFSADESHISDSQQEIKKFIRELWLNFVKTGKPVPEASAEYPSGWSPAGAAGSPYMEVALPPRLRHDLLLQERLAFWDQVYEAHLSIPVPPPVSESQTPINAGKSTLICTYILPMTILSLFKIQHF